MHEAIRTMIQRYSIATTDGAVNALREIMQQLALLGLWRSKFFEHAAFYGGSALRILHGLSRYSEDLDFSLLHPNPGFTWGAYGDSLKREIEAFGFEARFQHHASSGGGPIESAFLKMNTLQQLVVIQPAVEGLGINRAQVLRIKLEVDTDPPPGFEVESHYLLQPIPFSVRVFRPPDLFAGKMHALLCRRLASRVKGRDWYDLVWYVGRGMPLRLKHLEARMRQSGDYAASAPLNAERLSRLLLDAVSGLDVDQARDEVMRFVGDPGSLTLWSRDFFLDIAARVQTV
ncbi:MAG: nucleotidyl transferase AbiEii/AbiGii toxin family protein [Spirochaetes bacterium]|jgi:hypothetical protein|nr:nucleotidyl transferase AbiEii/AbiGii toxin family protein [Spirochaetota bacterium]